MNLKTAVPSAFLAISVAVPGLAIGDEPTTIKLAAPNNWCPVACDAESKTMGIYIELSKAIWPNKKIEYTNLPYSRAIADTKSGRIHAIPAALAEEVPGFILPDTPGSEVRWCFWVTKKSTWTYKNLNSLDGLNIGSVDSYEYPEDFMEHIKSTPDTKLTPLHGDNSMNRLISMVQYGRLDTIIEADETMPWTLKINKIKDIKKAGCLDNPVPAFLAFSPAWKYSPQMAQEFTEGMKKLKDSGDLQKIRARYLDF